MYKFTVSMVFLVGWGLFSASAAAQPSLYRPFICPMLNGSYANGDKIKNADGQAWTLSFQADTAIHLKIDHWRRQYTVRAANIYGYTLYCVENYGGVIVTATHQVANRANCYVNPETAYPLFGCY